MSLNIKFYYTNFNSNASFLLIKILVEDRKALFKRNIFVWNISPPHPFYNSSQTCPIEKSGVVRKAEVFIKVGDYLQISAARSVTRVQFSVA